MVPSGDEAALLHYFSANLDDHTATATKNVLASPGPAPFFERAVHYNGLTQASLDELNHKARALHSEVLDRLNAEALRLQSADKDQPDAAHRFRSGAFIYSANDPEESSE